MIVGTHAKNLNVYSDLDGTGKLKIMSRKFHHSQRPKDDFISETLLCHHGFCAVDTHAELMLFWSLKNWIHNNELADFIYFTKIQNIRIYFLHLLIYDEMILNSEQKKRDKFY